MSDSACVAALAGSSVDPASSLQQESSINNNNNNNTTPSITTAAAYPERISDGDTVIISGGGLNKSIIVRHKAQMKLGRVGNVHISSLIGQRYGDVFMFEDKTRRLVPTLETPELDRSDIQAGQVMDEEKDNRELFDTHGANQSLTEEKIHALREEAGVENVIKNLVENSASFATKTAFAQEKYVRKKKGKYIAKFKVERLNPDNLCETIVPTLLVEADEDEDSKRRLAIRVDTMGLMLHHANASGSMRVIVHDRTNGVLSACLLYRLGAEGQIIGVYDKTSMPSTVFVRAMHVPDWKARWKAVPASPSFFSAEAAAAVIEANAAAEANGEELFKKRRWNEKHEVDNNTTNQNETEENNNNNMAGVQQPSTRGITQWVRAVDARADLLANAADALVVAGFEDEALTVVRKLFPFLALSGNLVVYCPFIEPLERIYSLIRDEAVCISISDTWYRHQQVLSGRTHPQVNMSTAGGFLLTAIKVEHSKGGSNGGNSNNNKNNNISTVAPTVSVGEKRTERDEPQQLSRVEAEAAAEASL